MLNTILGILILVMSVFLVATILLQSSKDHRMSGTIAGGAETFFGKQKGKTMDGFLNKLTIIVCVLFFVVVLVMYIAQPEVERNVVTDIPNIEVSDDAETETGDNVVTPEDLGEAADDAETPAPETETETETDAVVETEPAPETETEPETGDNEVSF